jgi:hypothetical protein
MKVTLIVLLISVLLLSANEFLTTASLSPRALIETGMAAVLLLFTVRQKETQFD